MKVVMRMAVDLHQDANGLTVEGGDYLVSEIGVGDYCTEARLALDLVRHQHPDVGVQTAVHLALEGGARRVARPCEIGEVEEAPVALRNLGGVMRHF